MDDFIPNIAIQQPDDESVMVQEPPLRLMAVIQEADTINLNRRIYPRKVLEQQIDRLQDDVRNRRYMGELGVPVEAMVHFSKASHLVTDLFMSDNKMMAEIEVLDTPAGQQLKTLLSAGVPIGFRMSGVGGGKLDDYGRFVVDESYKLVQIFACNDPA